MVNTEGVCTIWNGMIPAMNSPRWTDRQAFRQWVVNLVLFRKSRGSVWREWRLMPQRFGDVRREWRRPHSV
jgi:hypothetical protein